MVLEEPHQQESDGLAAAIAEYLTRVDRGEQVCRETFLAKHPSHVAGLSEYFADADRIQRLTGDPANISLETIPQVPRQFGDFDLLQEIGRGGMGIVYRARERTTGRLVALKMLLHSLFLSAAEVARFRNESRTAANLRHPGIMPIYYVGEHQGQMFFTMPLVQCGSLAQRLANGPVKPELAANWLLAVSEAIAVAHRRHIVHRDLKPANVLLDEHENPVVADFGLARRLSEEPLGITVTGDLLGTPNYMAPEQVNGPHSNVGPPADIYALGAILYALVVGRPPFHSASVSETLHKICTAEPARPRQLRRGVPRDLETICLKSLEKSPDNRYRTAEDLAEDLRRFLAGKPPLAKRISSIERGRRWFVRNPVIGSLAAAVVVALVSGTCFSLYYAGEARERERQAVANLYAADMNLAQQHLRSGAVASALRLLERHRRPDPPPQPSPQGGGRYSNSPPRSSGEGQGEGPNWEWRYLWHQCHGELRRFEGPKGAVYAAAFSPDGRTVAAAGADRTVWLWETATGNVRHKLTGHTAAIRDLAFAHDGRRLVTVGDDRVAILWNLDTHERITTLTGHETPLTTVVFSADGSLIATAGNGDTKVNLWQAGTGRLFQSLDIGPTESVAFSPDGARLAIAGRDGCIRVCLRGAHSWDVETTIQGHADVVYDLAWNPDGTRLASAGADHVVKLWDTDSWRELESIGVFRESIYDINFRPDGRHLAMAARNEPLKVWDLDEQQIVAELLGHTALVSCVDYCPDGWRLISASEDGTVRMWDAARGTDHDRLEAHAGGVRSVGFAPSGELLASGGAEDSSIILWNATTGQPLRVLRALACGINDLAFSLDGKFVAAVESGGHLRIWDVAEARATFDLTLPIAAVAWTGEEYQLAAHCIDGSIKIIDAASGHEVSKWKSPKGTNGGFDVNSRGTMIVASGDWVVHVWYVATRSLEHELRGHSAPVIDLIFSPRGNVIASSSNDKTIRLWSTATGQLLRVLTGHAGTAWGLAFSPDGKRLVSGSTDQTVKVWDVETGLQLQSLGGHADWVRDVAIRPDGVQLASAGSDGTVRIWHAPNAIDDWATRREAAALMTHLAGDFSSREDLVAAVNADKTINDAVRVAAVDQSNELLLYWPHVLAGHRAAERQDWAAAIEAFQRVSRLAPDDMIYWHWVAMAGLSAGRSEVYQAACQEMLRRCDSNSPVFKLFLTLRSWLAARRSNEELVPLRALVDAYSRQVPDAAECTWLYELRAGNTPLDFLGTATPPATLGPQSEDWYVLAMVWLKLGDESQARAAYQEGVRFAREDRNRWDWSVYTENLRREVEELLAGAQSQREPALPKTPDSTPFSERLPSDE